MAISELALPADDVEFLSTQGLCVLFVAALIHDPSELPLARVYVKSVTTGEETELESLFAVTREDPANAPWAKLYGVHRYMALFPLKIEFLSNSTGLFVDFARNRAGFRVSVLEPPGHPFPSREIRRDPLNLGRVVFLLLREFPIREEMLSGPLPTPTPAPSPTSALTAPPRAGPVAQETSALNLAKPAPRANDERSDPILILGGLPILVAYLFIGRRRLRSCDGCGAWRYSAPPLCHGCEKAEWTREAQRRLEAFRTEEEGRAQAEEALRAEEVRRARAEEALRAEEARRARAEEALRTERYLKAERAWEVQRGIDAFRAGEERRALAEEALRGEEVSRARAEEALRVERDRRAKAEEEVRRAEEARQAKAKRSRDQGRSHGKRDGAPWSTSVAATYEILGMEQECPFGSAKNILRGLRMAYHPDRHLDPGARRAAEERLKTINGAWDTVKAARDWGD